MSRWEIKGVIYVALGAVIGGLIGANIGRWIWLGWEQ